MKILMLGNFQTRALVAAWTAMRPGDDVAFYELQTLISNAGIQARVRRRIELADIIVHHHVGEDYPVAFARTAALAQHPKAARVCVPMIYFAGLQPDITYIGSLPDRLQGPMGGYHSRITLTEFLSGHDESTALASVESEERYSQLGYFGEFDRGLAELTRSDGLCHIAGTPILLKYIQERPTLYTMDHPTNIMFKSIVTATFDHLGLDFGDVDPEYIPATFSEGCVWPPSPLIHGYHGLKFPASRFMKAGVGARRVLSLEDFVWESYQCYREAKAKLSRMEGVEKLLADIGLDVRTDEQLEPPAAVPGSDGPFRGRPRVRMMLQDLANVVERAEREPAFARDVANEALWASPADGQSSLNLSQLLSKLGARTEAIDVLRGCISRLDGEPTLRSACADRLLELGAGDLVEEELAALNDQKGLDHEALEFVVRYARRLGKTGLALNAALKMLHTAQNPSIAYARMAHVAMDAKQPGLAIAAIEKAIEYEPRNGHHFALRGYALDSLGCRPAAIRDYETAVSLDPEYSDFRRSLKRLREMMSA